VSSRWRLLTALALPFSLAASVCPPTVTAGQTPPASQGLRPEGGPKLVLLLVVDQFGADELERIGPLFSGGFRTLLSQGVSFTQAHHAHAVTETGPGHATLATGCFPRHHGIVSNWWIEEGSRVSRWAIDDDLYDESPRGLEATTFGDWLKQRYPESRVFSASGKDRSAILMGGRGADAAFWYDEESGGFTTSDYYDEPEWLESFNGQRLLEQKFGETWEPLPLSREAIAELELHRLDLGPLGQELPITVGPPRLAPDESFYTAVRDSPWWDEYLAQFARFLIEAEDLGVDGYPDLLALSFSAADYVGHDYGPNSREYVDLLLRLDRTLGELLAFIDQRVGLERTIIGLSADHGVVPVPEVRQGMGLSGERVGSETVRCLQNVGRLLAAEHGVESWLVSGPRLASGLSESVGRTRPELERETAERLEECPGIEAIWTSSDLIEAVDESEHLRWLYANAYHPQRSPDFLIQFEEYFMPSLGSVTTHGSPYAYDTRVPMLVLAPGLEALRLDLPVRTVDLAPTLAALAGIPIPRDVDGRALLEPVFTSP
jgi:predicted AlkP superfamily pyrophosphatase or phosphodiesterase